MTVIDIHSEFAHEILLAVPYAHWLSVQGEPVRVITSTGMSPFYYFCDEVEEVYKSRSLDNKNAGLNFLPNNWPHHNALAVAGKNYEDLTTEEQRKINGVLDYRKWLPPSYQEHYSSVKFLDNKYVVVNNLYNIEAGNDIKLSKRLFDIVTLNRIFNILTERGYTVVYKRPNNTEFAPDPNELITLSQEQVLTYNDPKVGKLTDYQLCEYYENVHNINDLVNRYSYSYNELQLRLFANADGFITPNGGGGILCGYFSKPIVMHVPSGKELRPGYLTNENCYFKKLSNNKLYPVFDVDNESNYNKVLTKIEEVFK